MNRHFSARYWVRWRVAVVGFAMLALSGCVVGPRYARPAAPAPPEYKEVPPNWKTAQPNDLIAKGKWWEVFEDAQLSALEEQINVSNQSLKAAQAQFEQARAAVRFNRSELYPNVTAGVNAYPEPPVRQSAQRSPFANQYLYRLAITSGCLLRSGRLGSGPTHGRAGSRQCAGKCGRR